MVCDCLRTFPRPPDQAVRGSRSAHPGPALRATRRDPKTNKAVALQDFSLQKPLLKRSYWDTKFSMGKDVIFVYACSKRRPADLTWVLIRNDGGHSETTLIQSFVRPHRRSQKRIENSGVTTKNPCSRYVPVWRNFRYESVLCVSIFQ
jgi:hypothetical protein